MRGVSGHGERWLRVLALVTLLSACGEPDAIVVEDGEQTEAFCDANCTRALQCGSSGSKDGCQAYCEASATGVGTLRAEVVQIAVRCIAELPCSGFFTDDAFMPCWDKASREAGPSPGVRRFCQTWSRRWFECGSSYSIDDCELDWGINGNAYLDEMLTCVDVDCELLAGCAEAVAGSP